MIMAKRLSSISSRRRSSRLRAEATAFLGSASASRMPFVTAREKALMISGFLFSELLRGDKPVAEKVEAKLGIAEHDRIAVRTPWLSEHQRRRGKGVTASASPRSSRLSLMSGFAVSHFTPTRLIPLALAKIGNSKRALVPAVRGDRAPSRSLGVRIFDFLRRDDRRFGGVDG